MPALRIVDSVTEPGAADAGCLAVTGSHGGLSSARFACAGIAGLALLQGAGLAACTVSHLSARIGDARSTPDDGIISHANALATALGVTAGQCCREALALLQNQPRNLLEPQ